jgi:hypothetical protein
MEISNMETTGNGLENGVHDDEFAKAAFADSVNNNEAGVQGANGFGGDNEDFGDFGDFGEARGEMVGDDNDDVDFGDFDDAMQQSPDVAEDDTKGEASQQSAATDPSAQSNAELGDRSDAFDADFVGGALPSSQLDDADAAAVDSTEEVDIRDMEFVPSHEGNGGLDFTKLEPTNVVESEAAAEDETGIVDGTFEHTGSETGLIQGNDDSFGGFESTSFPQQEIDNAQNGSSQGSPQDLASKDHFTQDTAHDGMPINGADRLEADSITQVAADEAIEDHDDSFGDFGGFSGVSEPQTVLENLTNTGDNHSEVVTSDDERLREPVDCTDKDTNTKTEHGQTGAENEPVQSDFDDHDFGDFDEAPADSNAAAAAVVVAASMAADANKNMDTVINCVEEGTKQEGVHDKVSMDDIGDNDDFGDFGSFEEANGAVEQVESKEFGDFNTPEADHVADTVANDDSFGDFDDAKVAASAAASSPPAEQSDDFGDFAAFGDGNEVAVSSSPQPQTISVSEDPMIQRARGVFAKAFPSVMVEPREETTKMNEEDYTIVSIMVCMVLYGALNVL